ncbi:MAG: hypothetical protein ACJA2G_003652 [Cognaticolwellia sp.]|jgi:hypothetical protein
MDIFAFNVVGFTALLISCTACSVNGYGIPGSVDQYTTDSPFSRTIHTKAKGLHVNTHESFDVHFGYLEKELIYPIVDNNIVCSSYLLDGDSESYNTEPVLFAQEPIKTIIKSTGLYFTLSSYTFGFSVGVLNRHVLRVNSEESFSMFYQNVKSPDTQVCAVIQSQFKGDNNEN